MNMAYGAFGQETYGQEPGVTTFPQTVPAADPTGHWAQLGWRPPPLPVVVPPPPPPPAAGQQLTRMFLGAAPWLLLGVLLFGPALAKQRRNP